LKNRVEFWSDLANGSFHRLKFAPKAQLGKQAAPLRDENLDVIAVTVDVSADTIVWLATLPTGGPTGGFFENRERIPW
jgi:hypothetical protein